MTIINGHYDGQGVVLDDPVPNDIKPDTPVRVHFEDAPRPESVLDRIARLAGPSDLPPDFSQQHDHYVKGTPRGTDGRIMTAIRWTEHALENLREREIDRSEVESTLRNPEFVVPDPPWREIRMRRYVDTVLQQEMLMRVVDRARRE